MYETNVKRASLLSNSYKFYRYCEKKPNLLAVYVFVLFLLNMKCLEVCCCWLHHIRGLKCFVTITSLKNLVWILRSSHALSMDMHAMVIWGEWNNCTAYIFSLQVYCTNTQFLAFLSEPFAAGSLHYTNHSWYAQLSKENSLYMIWFFS